MSTRQQACLVSVSCCMIHKQGTYVLLYGILRGNSLHSHCKESTPSCFDTSLALEMRQSALHLGEKRSQHVKVEPNQHCIKRIVKKASLSPSTSWSSFLHTLDMSPMDFEQTGQVYLHCEGMNPAIMRSIE